LFEKRRRRFLEREIGGSVEARAVDSEREMWVCVRAVVERVWLDTSFFSDALGSPSMVVLLQKSRRRRERMRLWLEGLGFGEGFQKRACALGL
jgi:hypothetical protein